MKTIRYAATRYGYCVQVIDDGEIVYEYTAGNCQTESQAVIDPSSRSRQTSTTSKRWAKQTADQIAEERGIPISRVEYDPDLEAQLEQCETV